MSPNWRAKIFANEVKCDNKIRNDSRILLFDGRVHHHSGYKLCSAAGQTFTRKRKKHWECSTGDCFAGQGGESCLGADLEY